MRSFPLIILASSAFAIPINSGGTGGKLAANAATQVSDPKAIRHTENGDANAAGTTILDDQNSEDGFLQNIVAGPPPIRDTSRMPKEARQLAELLGPALAALEPLAQGIDQGVTAGATNVNAAAHDAGLAVDQAAQGVGDAAQGVTQGAGETVAEVPGAADRTAHNLEHAGLAGTVITTLTGAPGE